MAYTLFFTRAALAVIAAESTREAVEAKIRAELDETIFDDPDHESGDFMHAVARGEDHDAGLWICRPADQDDVVVVDSGSMQPFCIDGEKVVLDKGPFKGFSVMMPVGDTPDETEILN